MRDTRGSSLIEMLVVLAIFSSVAVMGTMALSRLASRVSLHTAALRVLVPITNAREQSFLLNRSWGVKFRQVGSRWTYTVHEDGNGNGIRNADIDSGVDPVMEGPFYFFEARPMADVQLPPAGTIDPDTGQAMDTSASPVQFNQSSICSCSPDGNCTPGSIFLTTAQGDAAFVRNSGELANIRIAYYDSVLRKWK